LAAGASGGAAWTAEHTFERLPHLEDEFANLWQASVMAQGRIWIPSPEEPRSFLVPFVVDFEGRRFGKYPPGWPAVLSLGVRLGIGWLVNPLLAGASVWLIFRLGSKLGGEGIGLLAAALSAVSPFLLVLAGSLMSHVFSLFLALAFASAWLDLFPRSESSPRQPAWLLVGVAGISLGLLALTRPLTAVGVALPFVVHGVVLLWSGRARSRGPLVAVAAVALAIACLYPLWNAALTGDPSRNPYTLWWPYDRIGFGPGIGRSSTGHTLDLARFNAELSLEVGRHDLFGWPYLSFAFLPLGLWAFRHNRDGWLVAGWIPSLIGVHLFYWIGSWLFGPRYYFEALPAAAALTAAGLAWLGGWGAAGDSSWLRARRISFLGLLVTLFALNGLYYLPVRLASLQGLYGISKDRWEVFAAGAPPNAFVLIHPAERWTDYGTLLTLEPPFCDCDLILAYSRGTQVDRRAAAVYPDRDVYHYYSEEPGVFRTAPR
jgi:4-amino-4-deoxy-L-arabinose transferase-like glycosyltransferase